MRFRWVWPWALIGTGAIASAQPGPSACETIVRIGFTPEQVRELGIEPTQCHAITTGNEYQLIDWLENGVIDAALLSPFAADLVMQSSTDEALKLFQATRALPFNGLETRAYKVGVEILEDGVRSIEPRAKLDEILLAAQAGSTPALIEASSHLDQGFIAFLAYAEERIAALKPANRQALWGALLGALRFGAAPAERATNGLVVRIVALSPGTEPPSSWLNLAGTQDVYEVLVYNTRLTSLLWNAPPDEAPQVANRGTVAAWLRGTRPSPATPNALLEFVHNNYRVAHAGSRQHRHFRFTVPELFAIMRDADTARPGDDPFGLVLTGGGVKAAYQTSIVQRLYEQPFLVNEAPGGNAAPGVIRVDHVIGTSGGALLGIFVSAIGDKVPDLTASLWRTRDGARYIASYDVFPFLDMPRYLSAVLSLMIFGLVCAAFYGVVTFATKRSYRITTVRAFRNVFAPSTLPPDLVYEEGSVNLIRPGAVWVALLFVTPWIIKFVTGQDVLEHVPAIAGIFYMGFAIVAIYSDNRVIHKQPFKWQKTPLSPIDALGLLLAVVMIFLPLLMERIAPFEWTAIDLVLGEIDVDVLITCIGFVGLFLLLHRCITRGGGLLLVPARLILQSFFILVLFVALPQAVLFATGKPTYELSLDFWWYLSVFSALAAVLVLAVAHWPNRQAQSNPVRATLDFLIAPFPRLTYTQKLRRFGRIVLFFAMSFVYWNFVMAPALYGNERAEDYLAATYAKFVCADAGDDSCDAPSDDALSWAPRTKFVMSATSLEQQEERYFLFHPQRFGARCVESLREVDQGALWELASIDRRWRIPHCNLNDAELLEVAFSSGSPFPVFPSKAVTIHKDSRLVDGGFAHNMPIEASVKLGARRTLVVSSSPLHQHDAASDNGDIWTRGFLFHNLGRLFPYLFSRSQVEDALSAQESLVATIAPLDRGADWPLLTDFHPAKIEYLIRAADADFDARIGVIESWGAALCTAPSGRVFSCRDKTGATL
jgi:predicted acylesterase/phospholipase RssA